MAERIVDGQRRVVIENASDDSIKVSVVVIGSDKCLMCGKPARIRLLCVDYPDRQVAALCATHYDNLTTRKIG